MNPASAANIMSLTLRLAGNLDERALRDSLSEIVRRHAVLRTTFPVLEARPVQRIGDARPVPLPVVDLSALPAPRREAVAQVLAREGVPHLVDDGWHPGHSAYQNQLVNFTFRKFGIPQARLNRANGALKQIVGQLL